jgi:Cu+-exporting ATPase
MDNIGMDPVSNNQKATIGIKGMTCHSCVKTIEQNLGELPGVISVNVSLSNEEGTVIFSTLKTNAETLVQVIEDSGFDASLKSVVEVQEGKKLKSDNEKKGMVSIELDEGTSENISPGAHLRYRFAGTSDLSYISKRVPLSGILFATFPP